MSFSLKTRNAVQIDFKDDHGLTEQSHKDSCDIHQILRKANKTGVLDHVNKYGATYGTMPTGEEFHHHMNIIATAETMFETVPSHIRKKFDNQPSKFLDFVQNPENKTAMEELGLSTKHLPKPVNPPTTKVENATEEVTSPS